MSVLRDTSSGPAAPVASPPGDDWWDEIVTSASEHTPIGELIAGLDDVATVAIPYARLPRRVRDVYSAEFMCWSDIAGQTVASLLSRPRVAEVGVRALLAAANDAVATYRDAATGDRAGAARAVQRLVDRLRERDRIILSARVWSPRPQALRTVAERLGGVHTVSVTRNQPRAQARFAELLADPAHHEVSDYAGELRGRLGPYVPASVVAAELRRLDIDPDSDAAQLLLHLAGPYVGRDEWVENTTTSGRQQAAATLDAEFVRCPAPSTVALVEALATLGMARDVATAYLDSQAALRRFGDLWVRWGDSTADQVEAVMHVRGAPATADDVFAAIATGPGGPTMRAVREALFRDHRFVRATRRTWALRAWGIGGYAGIFDEITARIDASAGKMDVEELVHDILSSVPDVAETSVWAYLGTLAFVVEAGVVRRRTDTDEFPPVPRLNTARGAFRNGRNEIRLAIAVTTDVLRGSGLPIRPAVAAALGVSPGQERVFTGPHGQVVVMWRLSWINGPSIGSLRAPARATAAELKDTLVLVFGLADASLDVVRIGADVLGMQRLPLLVGHSVRSPAAALATSLGCRKTDVAAVLRKRGDGELAELVQE